MDNRVHTLSDGSLAAVIGSPHGEVALRDIEHRLLLDDFVIPWDGRVVVLRISADGRRWTLWNDWLGSIPVFHAQIGQGRVASTLEPAVVAAAGYTSRDFFLPGLLSLLINGHFISDWTLYEGMKTMLPDSITTSDEEQFHSRHLSTVMPSQDRWETGWDDLVDEMHEVSQRAISEVLRSRPSWCLPLSSGLDSRLVAGVAANKHTDLRTYTWGDPDSTDVIYSRQIAKTLGYPWKHIELPRDFLARHTPQWADLFGSGLHFHGMYLIGFLKALEVEPDGQILSGFVGDPLAGDPVDKMMSFHSVPRTQVSDDWHVFWTPDELKTLLRIPVDEALGINAEEIRKQIERAPGARFQKLQYLAFWNRQRHFISFQTILGDYWRGVATPFMNRAYARFCLSLPRIALDDRRLQAEMLRRYYGKLAVIPGTYAEAPYILTGRYLLLRRLARSLAPAFHVGPLRGFQNVPLRMDVTSLQATGAKALWPLFDVKDRLSEWLDFTQFEDEIRTLMHGKEDVRPLRKLQSAQTLAFRLL